MEHTLCMDCLHSEKQNESLLNIELIIYLLPVSWYHLLFCLAIKLSYVVEQYLPIN